MKILVLTDTYKPQTNGVVSYLEDSLEELSLENEVVLLAPGLSSELEIEHVNDRFKIYWIPSSPFPLYDGYRISSLNYKRISGIIKRETPDIVHAHAPVILGVQGIIAGKRRRIPIVVTYHTHFPDYVPHLLKGRLPPMLQNLSSMTVRNMIKQVYGKADIVTAPTRELAAELESYGLTNVAYLPNGVRFQKLKTGPERVEAFRRKMGLEGRKVVLYIGRISFEKRLEQLISAFEEIEKEGRMLLIVGGGPYLDRFCQFAESIGVKDIRFCGFLDKEDLGAAYACGDVFASPSDSETFGLTFIEAMNFGMPVVGVKRLGPKELIRSGKNGYLVEPGDIRGMAKAIEKLLEDDNLRRRMGQEARRFSEGYSIEKSVQRLARMYRDLIRAKARARKGDP
jgi:glycosyltransferase involved in cell wall biosynthesis